MGSTPMHRLVRIGVKVPVVSLGVIGVCLLVHSRIVVPGPHVPGKHCVDSMLPNYVPIKMMGNNE